MHSRLVHAFTAHARTLLQSIFIGVLVLQGAQAFAATLSPAVEAKIDAIARDTVSKGKTAGLVVAVADRDGVLFNRGYGMASLELDVPMNAGAVFRIGSVTKQFASASILLLAEQGKLSLDDKLSKYFPDFPRGGEVSIRQLLNHTSGIRSFTAPLPEEISRVGATVPQLVKHIAGLGYDFDPGTDFRYNNSAFLLIGAIIEQVSGQEFRDFAREQLFAPAGMKDTALDRNEEIVHGRVAGYAVDPNKPGGFLNAEYSHMSVPHAAGALRSTTADLVRWNAALHGGKVLKPSSLKEMKTAPQLPPLKPGAPERQSYKAGAYALGLAIGEHSGHAVIEHGGAIEGFAADLKYFVNDGITLVVLANTEGGTQQLGPALSAALFAVDSAKAEIKK